MPSLWTRLSRRFKKMTHKITDFANQIARRQNRSLGHAAPITFLRAEDELSAPGAWSASDAEERYVSVADLRARIGLGPLPIQVVKLIARDVLRGLENLREARGIAHADLSLSTIMLSPRDMRALVSQLSAESQMSLHRSEISFETMFLDVNSMLTSTSQPVFVLTSAEPDGQGQRGTVEARALRAPEVILGAPYEPSADIWTLGCLIYELLAGESLFDPQFQTLDLGLTPEESHLIQMIEILGPFPPDMLKACPHADQWFTDTGTLRIDTTYYPVTLEAILHARIEADDVPATAAFLEVVLRLDPNQRFRARDLINHPWFTAC